MSTRILVGVFESQGDAHEARSELLRQGCGTEHIEVSGEHHEPEAASSVERSRSMRSMLGEMFRSLFMELGGRSDDERLYDEALRQGNLIIAVRVSSDEAEAMVHEVMERHHAVDIHERSRDWAAFGEDEQHAASRADLTDTPQQAMSDVDSEALPIAPPPRRVRVYQAGRKLERQ